MLETFTEPVIDKLDKRDLASPHPFPCPSPYYLFRYQYSGSLAPPFSPAS